MKDLDLIAIEHQSRRRYHTFVPRVKELSGRITLGALQSFFCLHAAAAAANLNGGDDDDDDIDALSVASSSDS